jgi:2-polyprenyl-3-methyl-5-hydroxy-6-metoxy-1,4-benzoquinol methylase
MKAESPLIKSFETKFVNEFDVKFLISQWKNKFNIDITREMKGYTTIYEFQCNMTKLYFFAPADIDGSDNLYKSLQHFDWYYMPEKWEHQIALKRLKNNFKVLEVGSGQGEFIYLCNKKGCNAVGIELNDDAVLKAKKKGLNVFKKNLLELAVEQPNIYDCVCAFQVLEHVSNPREFIKSCITLLKPEGKLIFCVPNADGLLASDFNLLDLPPHHMTRWNKTSFQSLEDIFPITLNKVYYEPLASYHWDWYLNLISRKSKELTFISKTLSAIKNRKLQKWILSKGINNLIKGHTIFVEFVKK